MIHRYTWGKLQWIDLESPTEEEITAVAAEYHFHPQVTEQLLKPTVKPAAEAFDRYMYLILHFPAFRTGGDDVEIDFIVGETFLISVRYDTFEPILEFGKDIEVRSITKPDEGEHGAVLFTRLIIKCYDALLREIERSKDALRDIEANIFHGREREMVARLSQVNRKFIIMQRTQTFHRDTLDSFVTAVRAKWGDETAARTKPVLGEYFRLFHALQAVREILGELRETNNSLLSTKQNEQMRRLSVVAFIALPISILTSLFQIDAVARPLIGSENDFWIFSGSLITLAVLAFLAFKFKKWL